MEIESIQDLQDAFAAYQKQVENLLPIARQQSNQEALSLLRSTWVRLKQGPIRTLVLGVSSAGKSTLINAISGAIVVPEGKRTVSPIPAWVYNRNASLAPSVKIMEEHDGAFQETPCGLYEFVSDYCYTATEAGQGTGQERFQDVISALVNVKSFALGNLGITLVDTPGIGVSEGDNERVQEILRNGCEMLIIQFWNLQNENVKQYFRDLLMEDDAPLRTLMEENRVFLVLNSPKNAFKHALLDTKHHVYATFDGWEAENRLFGVNVLDARIRACGTYNYPHYLTKPFTPEEWNHAEQELSLEMQRKEIAQEQKGLAQLCQAMSDAAEEMCEDPEAMDRLLNPIRENISLAMALLEKPILEEIEQIKIKKYFPSKELQEKLEQMEDYYQKLIQYQSDVQSKLDLGADYSRVQWPLDNIKTFPAPEENLLLYDRGVRADPALQRDILEPNAPEHIALKVRLRMQRLEYKLCEDLGNRSSNQEIRHWEDFFQGMVRKLLGETPMGNVLVETQKVQYFEDQIRSVFRMAKEEGRSAVYRLDPFRVTDEEEEDLIRYLTEKRNTILAGGIRGRMAKFWLHPNLTVDKLKPMLNKAWLDGREVYMKAYRAAFWGEYPRVYQHFRKLLMGACVDVGKQKKALQERIEGEMASARQKELDALNAQLQQLRDQLKA